MILFVGAAVTVLIGYVVIGNAAQGWIARLALGFAAGAGVLSFQMFVYSLFHVPWHPALVLAPWAPIAWWRLRPLRHGRGSVGRLSCIEWIALAAALIGPLLWFPYERVMPLTTRNWDSWAIWLFKAKAFYLDGSIQPFLRRATEFNAQPSYPLLIPLFGTFLYTLAGSPADQVAKGLSPCFFFALLGAFYVLARRFATRPVALVFTAMLANLHMANIVAFELAGYADTALSVYLLLGAGYLYAWWREDRRADLGLAALFSGLAAWTKNEGAFFLAGVLALIVGRLAVKRSRDPRLWAAALACPLLSVVPWFAVRHVLGVPGTGLFGGGLNWGNLAPGLLSIVSHAFDTGPYNLTFWLLAASLLLHRRAGLDSRWWLLPGLVLWQMSGLLAVYLTGRNEIQWWIGTSLDRILAQLAPLGLFAAALVAAGWIAAHEKTPAPQPQLTRRRSSRNLKTSSK